jgi:hypothetical protein
MGWGWEERKGRRKIGMEIRICLRGREMGMENGGGKGGWQWGNGGSGGRWKGRREMGWNIKDMFEGMGNGGQNRGQKDVWKRMGRVGNEKDVIYC